ncbi:hypothetical protein [Sphingomonas sp. ID0503]|uniref:hypothetical protein n=1 Tax=Sphingomonas sp. ID0503 TaxID=3399691 RepID=UPI003AFB7ABE
MPTLMLATSISFSGEVPPHLAHDGVMYTATGVDVEALKACGIRDVSRGVGSLKFAVGPKSDAKVLCVKAAAASIEARASWAD